jgi:uncharacterized UPF0160 family protein
MFYQYLKGLKNHPQIWVGTHDGVFHTDEVAAFALLQDALKTTCPNCIVQLIRTRDKDVLSACHILLDVGGEHCLETGRFDHHQDRTCTKSSFGLLYDAVSLMCPLNDMSEPFFAQFVSGIDTMDVNPMSVTPVSHEGVRSLQQIISGFNRVDLGAEVQLDQFFKAVDFMAEILKNEFLSAQQKGKAEIEYFNREVLENNVAFFDSFSPIWKEKRDHQFAIMPYTVPGQWQIVSADTTVAVIPEEVNKIDGFIFRHNSGFMATFNSLEAVIKAVKALVYEN